MFKLLLRKPKFVLGSSFLLFLLIVSFLYEPLIEIHVDRYDFFMKDGEMLGPPFSPGEVPPFGTDRLGGPLWSYIIQGAKFTILAGAFISVLQVLAALLFSIFLINYFKKMIGWVEGLVDSMIYVPVAVIAYMLLIPLEHVMEAEENTIGFLSIQVCFLILIGIPPLIALLAKEIKKALNEEFVHGARTLGARGWHLYRKHILNNLTPRLVLLFVQQNVKTLVLFAHLSFFKIFLGGSYEEEIMMGVERTFSLSNEWAGNIGKAYFELMLAPWLVFTPLLAFSAVVLSWNFISSSIQEVAIKKGYPAIPKKRELYGSDEKTSYSNLKKDQFEFYNNPKNTPM
ncbi:MAG: ABC transporter permease subunit [Bacillota bacterium]